MTICFIDTETTGLDCDLYELWEVAIIVRDHWDPSRDGEWVWQLKPRLLNTADPMALRISRYYEREQFTSVKNNHVDALLLASPKTTMPQPSEPKVVAKQIAYATDGATFAGIVPDFDAGFLTRLLRRHNYQHAWHYHLLDVETLGAGWLAGMGREMMPLPPWSSDGLSELCGVKPPDKDERHTALGDARWAMRWYDHVTGQ